LEAFLLLVQFSGLTLSDSLPDETGATASRLIHECYDVIPLTSCPRLVRDPSRNTDINQEHGYQLPSERAEVTSRGSHARAPPTIVNDECVEVRCCQGDSIQQQIGFVAL
jgi:hypothetical protein